MMRGLSRLAMISVILAIVVIAGAASFIILQPRAPATPGATATQVVTTPTEAGRTTQPGTPIQQTPASKKDILKVAIGTDLDTVDPHGQTSITVHNVLRHVYETLVWLDDRGNVVPWLAERWDVSQDGLVYTFYLRKGVRFHDGFEFNATVVKANIDRWIDPTVRVPLRAQLGPVKGAEVIDPYTVKIYLKEPFAPFLRALSSYLLITSIEVIKRFGNQTITEVVGTGPYKFISWEKGRKVVLERFDDYWGQKPAIKRIEWLIIPEASTRIAALLSGDVDFIYAAPAPDLPRLSNDPRVKIITPVSNLIMFIALAPKGPLADPRVRQALNYAVDKKAIIDSVLYGLGIPADSPIPPHFFGYAKMPYYEYDPEKAKRLLAEAGYPDGFKIVLLHSVGGSGYVQDKQQAEALQAYLSKIGIQVELKTGDWPYYIASLLKPTDQLEWDAALVGVGPPVSEAYFTLNSQFTCAQIPPKGINTARYCNPKVDELINLASKELNENKRAELYRQAIEIIWRDAPWIFLYTQKQFFASSSTLEGIFVYPSGLQIYFQFAYFK
jgi:peptide/nickel transport system substrate-binding protein